MSYVRCLSLVLFLLFCLRANSSDTPGFHVSETGIVANNLVFTVEPGVAFEAEVKKVSGQHCFSLADFFSASGIKFSNFNHKGPIGLRFSLFIPSEVPDAEFPFYYYSSYALKGKSLGVLSTAGLEHSRWVTATVWLPSFQIMESGEALYFGLRRRGENFYFDYQNSFFGNPPLAEYGLIEEERKAFLRNDSKDYESQIFVAAMDVRFPEPLSEQAYQKIAKGLSTLPGENFLLRFSFVFFGFMLLLPFFLMRNHLSMKILFILFLPVLPLIVVLFFRAHEFFGSLADNVTQNILEEQQQDFNRLRNFVRRAEIEEEGILRELTDELYQAVLNDQSASGDIAFVLYHKSFRDEWEQVISAYEKGQEVAKERLVEFSVKAVSRFEPHKRYFFNSLPLVGRGFEPHNPPLPSSPDWKAFKDYIYGCSCNGSKIAALIQEAYWKYLLRFSIYDDKFLIENNYNGSASRGGPAIMILTNQILRENGTLPENLPEMVRDNSRGFEDLTEFIQSGGVNINFIHGYFDQPRSFHAHRMQKGIGYSKEMWDIRQGREDSKIIFRLLSDNFLLAHLLCNIINNSFPSGTKDYFFLANIRSFDFPVRNFNHPYLARGAVLVETGNFKGSMFFADREGELFGLYGFPEEQLKPYIPVVGRFIHQDFIALKYLKLRYFGIGFLLLLAFGASAVFISRHILKSLSMLASGMDRIRQRDYDCEVRVFSRDEFKQLSVICNKLRFSLSEKERLTGFLAAETRASVNIQDFSTTREPVAIIFCGILNASAYEQMDFNAQSNIFNLFLNSVQEAIFAFNGSVDKFTGQACLGFFRAVHAYKLPLRAATEIRRVIQELNREFAAAGKKELEVGIGIATGDVVLGYIGSEKRRDFTSIGNTVNTVARLETFAKGRGRNTGIFFDQETFQLNQTFLADSKLIFCRHDGILLKGKQGEQVIYELL